jgi:transcriptional regulator with XRE-family HTH domain
MGASKIDPVADRLGIEASTLYTYKMANKNKKPSPEVMKKLGDLLGRDYTLLLEQPINPSGNDDDIYIPWFSTKPSAGRGGVAEEKTKK